MQRLTELPQAVVPACCERSDLSDCGKGAALADVIERLELDEFDAVAVLDADVELEAGAESVADARQQQAEERIGKTLVQPVRQRRGGGELGVRRGARWLLARAIIAPPARAGTRSESSLVEQNAASRKRGARPIAKTALDLPILRWARRAA